MRPITREGDILMYFRSPNAIDLGIDLFEWFKRHGDPTYFYHTSVAVDCRDQIEAARRIRISPITTADTYLIFRPPVPQQDVRNALGKLRKRIGQRYGYLLIIDDALKYLSRDRVHLPDWLMTHYHLDDCSALVAEYFGYAQWGPELGRSASPQDVWRAVRRWPVKCEEAF